MTLMPIVAEPVLRRPPTPGWLDGWAAFAARITIDDLPPEVVSRTQLVLADCIAAIAAGAQEPEIAALVERGGALYGGGAGTPLIGRHRRAPAAFAAFVNGTAGTMLELDEGNQYARGHPGIHVVPAALAAAESLGRSGAELLVAVALGYEIGARIGIASRLRVTMHPHGTWGTVGAALAAARLAKAPPAAIVEAINVASCLGLATSRRTMLEGGTVRNGYAGFSNQLGLVAWSMVEAGFCGEADGLGTVYGSVIAEDWRPAAMVAELGLRWEIARNYFKRHACCRYNHAALDALDEIVAAAGGAIAPEQIRRIEVESYVWAAQLASQEPHNMLAAKFSLPFSIATRLVHGAASVAAFRDAARADPRVQALTRRVVVREDPALTAALPGARPARVTVHLDDGRTLTASARTNRGDTENPYPETELKAKFEELTAPVWGEAHARSILAAVDALDRAARVDGLCALLAA
jgi:2-methylcitrate dehydratase PrpD